MKPKWNNKVTENKNFCSAGKTQTVFKIIYSVAIEANEQPATPKIA